MSSTKTDDRVLRRSVTVFNEESGNISYEAGTYESDMRPGDSDYITNPKAWTTESEMFEDFTAAQVGARKATARLPIGDTTEVEGDEVEDEYSAMTVPELRDYADANNIDLGNATRKSDILKAIRSAG